MCSYHLRVERSSPITCRHSQRIPRMLYHSRWHKRGQSVPINQFHRLLHTIASQKSTQPSKASNSTSNFHKPKASHRVLLSHSVTHETETHNAKWLAKSASKSIRQHSSKSNTMNAQQHKLLFTRKTHSAIQKWTPGQCTQNLLINLTITIFGQNCLHTGP
jgi:hypothetical protein